MRWNWHQHSRTWGGRTGSPLCRKLYYRLSLLTSLIPSLSHSFAKLSFVLTGQLSSDDMLGEEDFVLANRLFTSRKASDCFPKRSLVSVCRPVQSAWLCDGTSWGLLTCVHLHRVNPTHTHTQSSKIIYHDGYLHWMVWLLVPPIEEQIFY